MTPTPAATWVENRVQKALEKEVMSPAERVGELVGIVVLLLVTAFFAYHQITGTGFFTDAFGPAEAVLFYGVVPFSIATGLGRAFLGRRNPMRPLEVIGSLWWAVASLWLLVVFPFDFTHLGDPLGSLGFLVSWIPDALARFVLSVGAIAGAANAVYAAWIYGRVRRRLAQRVQLTVVAQSDASVPGK